MIEAQASLPSEKGEKMTSARMISELIQKNKNITQIEIEEKLKHGISLICDDPLSN
jgi:Trp operon repressor